VLVEVSPFDYVRKSSQYYFRLLGARRRKVLSQRRKEKYAGATRWITDE
jgi:hypothetical protein